MVTLTVGSRSNSDGDNMVSDNGSETRSCEDDASITNRSVTSAKSADESSSTIKEQISKQESKDVFRLRMLVVVVLVLTAAVVSCTVYWLTSDGESDTFEAQYEGAADKIMTCKCVVARYVLAA
jgi:cobalamin biosynthesis Mg chelatase CobN